MILGVSNDSSCQCDFNVSAHRRPRGKCDQLRIWYPESTEWDRTIDRMLVCPEHEAEFVEGYFSLDWGRTEKRKRDVSITKSEFKLFSIIFLVKSFCKSKTGGKTDG